MREVEAGEKLCFVCPRLPDVVPKDLPSRAEDDVGPAVVPHQVLPARPIDLARHGLPEDEVRVALEEVKDGRADALHVHDRVAPDRSAIRLLAAALRIEVRLIEDDRRAVNRKDFRAELLLAAILVDSQAGRGGGLRDPDSRWGGAGGGVRLGAG